MKPKLFSLTEPDLRHFEYRLKQRVLKTLAQGLSGGLRLVAVWCSETADRLQSRSRELLLESGRDSQEQRIEQEFRRLESSYARDLAEYPRLHLKLDENITQIDSVERSR